MTQKAPSMQGDNMATKSENADIAVLQSQMKTVIDGLSELKDIIHGHANLYIPREEAMLIHKQTMATIETVTKTVEVQDRLIETLKSDSDQIRGAVTLLKIVTAFLMAMGAVVGGLWWTKK